MNYPPAKDGWVSAPTNSPVILFEIRDAGNNNEHGVPDEFWMTIDREKLGELAEFIKQYLENN